MTEDRFGGLACEDASDMAAGFVLGALEPDEAAAVRAHLAACPHAHPEFAELGAVVPALLVSVPIVEPPALLRSRIMDMAARERGLSAAAGTAGVAIGTAGIAAGPPLEQARQPLEQARQPLDQARLPVEQSGGPRTIGVQRPAPVTLDRPRLMVPRWSGLLRIAAVLAIVALGVSNLSLQQGLRDADRYATAVTAALDLAARPGSTTAVLAPATQGGPSGLAAVGSDGSLAIAVRGLAATVGGGVYEAWVIEGAGPPVPIGSFTVGPDGYGALAIRARAAPAGAVIALTREPGPGATAPTLPIVVSGASQGRPG